MRDAGRLLQGLLLQGRLLQARLHGLLLKASTSIQCAGLVGGVLVAKVQFV